MQYGQINGLAKRVSRLVQGSSTPTPEMLPELFDLAYERGINSFDSAAIYGEKSERAVGEWVRTRGVQSDIVLIAKGAHHSERKRVTPEDIDSDLRQSMDRMGLEYFDAYVLHRDDPDIPVGEIIDLLDSYVDAGRIGVYGGSNWTHQRIDAANRYALDHGKRPMAISSPNMSLAVQIAPPWAGCVSISADPAARDYYRAHAQEVAVVAWSSLAGGFFSGRFTPDNIEQMRESSGYFDRVAALAYASDENFARLRRAQELAAARGCTLAQIALAYVMRQPMNLFALTFCAGAQEFDQNAAAVDIALSSDEISFLECSSAEI